MDQFVIGELEAQLLKEKEARQEVEEQLSTERKALRVSKVGHLLLGTDCQSEFTACHNEVSMLCRPPSSPPHLTTYFV